MPSYNRVILMGNLTRDPEIKFTASNTAVGKFGLAVNRKFKDKEEVTFVDVECWGKTAELVGQYLTKGRAVLIEGRLRQDQWEDKNTGAKRSRLLVVADNVNFVGGRDDAQQGSPHPARTAPAAEPYQAGGDAGVPSADLGDDEPPF